MIQKAVSTTQPAPSLSEENEGLTRSLSPRTGAQLYQATAAGNGSFDTAHLARQSTTLISQLEHASETLLFSTGMSLLSALLAEFPAGETIILQSGIYWGTSLIFRRLCERNQLHLFEVDPTDTQTFASVIREKRPALVFLEVPSNPFLRVCDIQLAADLAHRVGATLLVDSTAATPLVIRPLEHGADLVMHGSIQALSGQNDTLGGILSTASTALPLWTAIKSKFQKEITDALSSEGILTLFHGLQTLGQRVAHMNVTALKLADFLSSHPKVRKVLYPGLPEDPSFQIAQKQMSGGFGSILSIITKGDREDALQVTQQLRSFQRSTALGGIDSIVEHRASINDGDDTIPDTLLRLSVGIEDPIILMGDLDQALDSIPS